MDYGTLKIVADRFSKITALLNEIQEILKCQVEEDIQKSVSPKPPRFSQGGEVNSNV